MDLHLHLFVSGLLVVAVCGQYSSNPTPSNFNLRPRRNALHLSPHQLQNEFNRQYKNHLYNIEEDNSSGYNDEEKETKPTKKEIIANNENLETSHQHAAMFNKGNIKMVRPAPEINRRSYDHTKFVANPETDKVLAKRYSQPGFEEEEHYAHPKYSYKYTVHDIEHLDIKHHQEERDGDHTVGEYSLLQPDGTILTVKYTVHGDEGFNAEVSKSEPVKEFEQRFAEHKNHHIIV